MTTATATQHPQIKSRDPHIDDAPLNGKDYTLNVKRIVTADDDGNIACSLTDMPDAVFEKPTPTQIDAFIIQYKLAKRNADATHEVAEDLKKRVIDLVNTHGYAPAHAEQSRRLEGALNTVTVTTGTTVTVNEPKVDELHELLNDQLGTSSGLTVFQSFFTTRIKHELTAGAEDALRTLTATKRTLQKVQAAFGQCISVKSKAPSVKIELREKQKPVRKPRAKKAVK